MGKKGPSEFCFQENSNLLTINHILYILKEILVSNQYVLLQCTGILTIQIVYLQ